MVWYGLFHSDDGDGDDHGVAREGGRLVRGRRHNLHGGDGQGALGLGLRLRQAVAVFIRPLNMRRKAVPIRWGTAGLAYPLSRLCAVCVDVLALP